jgi:hypothetical protein
MQECLSCQSDAFRRPSPKPYGVRGGEAVGRRHLGLVNCDLLRSVIDDYALDGFTASSDEAIELKLKDDQSSSLSSESTASANTAYGWAPTMRFTTRTSAPFSLGYPSRNEGVPRMPNARA